MVPTKLYIMVFIVDVILAPSSVVCASSFTLEMETSLRATSYMRRSKALWCILLVLLCLAQEAASPDPSIRIA